MLSERDRKMNPYFSINRDEENDWYEVGYNEGLAGASASVPEGKLTKQTTYMNGWLAGDAVRKEMTGE